MFESSSRVLGPLRGKGLDTVVSREASATRREPRTHQQSSAVYIRKRSADVTTKNIFQPSSKLVKSLFTKLITKFMFTFGATLALAANWPSAPRKRTVMRKTT